MSLDPERRHDIVEIFAMSLALEIPIPKEVLQELQAAGVTPDELSSIMAEAQASVTVVSSIDIGETVICDICNKDWTDSTESGGLLFGSKAVCPRCAPAVQKDAIRFGETEHIRAYCPEGKSFKDWVVDLRGGDNTIQIRTW
jgi:hypothetical protein